MKTYLSQSDLYIYIHIYIPRRIPWFAILFFRFQTLLFTVFFALFCTLHFRKSNVSFHCSWYYCGFAMAIYRSQFPNLWIQHFFSRYALYTYWYLYWKLPRDKTSFLYAKQRRHYLCSNGLNLIFRKVMLVNVLARKISFMNSSNFSKSQFNYRPLIWMSYSCEKIGKKLAAWKVPKIHLHDKQSSLNELLEKDAFILIQEGSFC